ncbi:MAG: CARDB domain-containing protein [Thiolinea sp.]
MYSKALLVSAVFLMCPFEASAHVCEKNSPDYNFKQCQEYQKKVIPTPPANRIPKLPSAIDQFNEFISRADLIVQHERSDLLSTDDILYDCYGHNGTLSIQNIGKTKAPASKTKIDFYYGHPVKIRSSVFLIPALSPGEKYTRNISLHCSFTPNCVFDIYVDYKNQVFEKNKKNNKRRGFCLG